MSAVVGDKVEILPTTGKLVGVTIPEAVVGDMVLSQPGRETSVMRLASAGDIIVVCKTTGRMLGFKPAPTIPPENIEEEYLTSIAYLGNNTILISSWGGGIYGRLHRSTDDGVTWHSVDMRTIITSGYSGGHFVCLTSLGGGVVLAGTKNTGHAGTIWKSSDYGVNWTLKHTPPDTYVVAGVIKHAWMVGDISNISWRSATPTGYVYATDSLSLVLMRSTNSGDTWSPIYDFYTSDNLYSLWTLQVAKSGTSNFVICTTTELGKVYQSQDDGATFYLVQQRGEKDIFDYSHSDFDYIDKIIMFGQYGDTIYLGWMEHWYGQSIENIMGRSRWDGGDPMVGTVVSQYVRDMTLAADSPSGNIVLSSNTTGIYRTTDGYTFTPVQTLAYVRGIDHISTTVMFAVADTGKIWQSTDAGATWSFFKQLYRPAYIP